MANPQSVLQFAEYSVNSLHFKLTETAETKTVQTQVIPQWSRRIERLHEDQYALWLRVEIAETASNPNPPFLLDVELFGVFSYKGENAKWVLEHNATAILFPYLRSTVSMLTMTANQPVLVLPTMNIAALFDEIQVTTRETGEESDTKSETTPK